MTVTYMTKRVSVEMKKALWNWAKRLDATEMTVWHDGSVSLYEGNDCICERYNPTAKELYKTGF
jgi:hypothetical protein